MAGYQSWASYRLPSSNLQPIVIDDRLFLGLVRSNGTATGAFAYIDEFGVVQTLELIGLPSTTSNIAGSVAGRVFFDTNLQESFIGPTIGFLNDQTQPQEGPAFWADGSTSAARVFFGTIWDGRLHCVNGTDYSGGYFVDTDGRKRPLVQRANGESVEVARNNGLFPNLDRGEVLALSELPSIRAAGWVGDGLGARYPAVWEYDGTTFSAPVILNRPEFDGRPAEIFRIFNGGPGQWLAWGNMGSSPTSGPQPFSVKYTPEDFDPFAVRPLERPGLALSAQDVRVIAGQDLRAVLPVTGPDGLPYLLIEPVDDNPLGCAVDLRAVLEPGALAPTSSTRLTGIGSDKGGSYGGTDYPGPTAPFPVWIAREEFAWRYADHVSTTFVAGSLDSSDEKWMYTLDGTYSTIKQPTILLTPTSPRIRVESVADFAVDPANSGHLTYRVTPRLADPATYVVQLSLYDFVASAWVDQSGGTALTTSMRTADYTVTSDVGRFRQQVGDKFRVRARFSVFPIGPVPPNTPARLEVEQARFLTRVVED